ncbi:ABC transporter permease [Kaistia geumhonensis]|uniref:Ribose transport system permease protein/putative xylitol transport system permease protein n=1 Tax=Kaistia geumhonensis TaxID=410839 RepID=A0ABU0M2L9_9HYPH|nr:ABC transporter permease [Kaistia geumhonensis]MCX5479600.1 ABC transporter permease [Kaistia geumhonensis]MDQ0515177.1 ribose transport system permease protein/putative xylitol transport system permease protein [Kaistia geumhonensis]
MSTTAPPTAAGVMNGQSFLARHAVSLYPLLVILALVAFFAVQNPYFATFDNAMNIGRQSSVLLLVALAGTMVIMIGSIDLSVGSIVTLSGIVTALAIDPFGPGIAIAAGVGAGIAVGLINGLTLIALKVPSFLVTLGMLSVLSGIANMICGGSSIMFMDQGLTTFVNSELVPGLPNIILIALLTAALLSFVAFKTVLGRYLYAIGGGEVVAANTGVPVNRYKVYAFMLSGGLCGLAGVLLTAQVGAGTPAAGANMLLDSIAAIVMGGTALSGGIGGPQRTILGVLVIAILSNGMDVTEVSSFTQEIVKGLVIILAVASTIDRKKYLFIK